MCDLCKDQTLWHNLTEPERNGLGMIEGYAQDVIDIINDTKEDSSLHSNLDAVTSDIKAAVSYLTDHMAAI